jgi:hypothetical protein
VSPTLAASPAATSAGGQIGVAGSWFFANCPDVQTAPGAPLTRPAPLGAVTLVVKSSDDVAHRLVTVKPGQSGSFEIRVTLPPDLPEGPATLFVEGYGRPADLTITAGRQSG